MRRRAFIAGPRGDMAVRGTGTTASDAVGVAADLKDGCLQVFAKIKAALARLMIGRGTSEPDEPASDAALAPSGATGRIGQDAGRIKVKNPDAPAATRVIEQ